MICVGGILTRMTAILDLIPFNRTPLMIINFDYFLDLLKGKLAHDLNDDTFF